MNHSEDQKQNIEKSSSSRFYTYLSYLIILLIPAYIIYQGVYQSAPEKMTTIETASESVYPDESQKVAAALIETQIDEVTVAETDIVKKEVEDDSATVNSATVNSPTDNAVKKEAAIIETEREHVESIITESTSTEPGNTESESSDRAAEEAKHEGTVVIVETASAVVEEVKTEVTEDSMDESVNKSNVTNPVLSSQSFAEIDQVITGSQEKKGTEKQPVYPDEVEGNINEEQSEKDLNEPSSGPVSLKSAAEEEQVAEVSTFIEPVVKAESSAESISDKKEASAQVDAAAKSDCSAISSKSFAEADADTTLTEEKEILERQEAFASNGASNKVKVKVKVKGSSEAKDCSKENASQTDMGGAEPSASKEPSTEIAKKKSIGKSEVIYPGDIETSVETEKKDPAALSSAPKAEQLPVTEIKTERDLDQPVMNRPMPQPPVSWRYSREPRPSEPVQMKRWSTPYQPSANQYRTPYQYNPMDKPDRSYQYNPYDRPVRSNQYNPYDQSARTYPYKRYDKPVSPNQYNPYLRPDRTQLYKQYQPDYSIPEHYPSSSRPPANRYYRYE